MGKLNKRSRRVHQDLVYPLISQFVRFCKARATQMRYAIQRRQRWVGTKPGPLNLDPLPDPHLDLHPDPCFFFKKIRVKVNDSYMIGKPNTLRPSLKMTMPRYIADHVKTTGHNIKWNHFDILAKGKTDYHCKIRDLFMQELSPAFNVNI